MVLGIARSHVFDRHLAEDAAQEAFATACERLWSLRDGNRFPQWMGTICRRIASKMSRLKSRSAPIICEPIAGLATDGAVDIKVRQAVEQLSSSAREVVQLHYFSGLSHDEIGKILGISPQAVHGRLQRARRCLREWLSKNGEQEMNDE